MKYYETDSVTLYTGDCLDEMKAIPDGTVQTCITSPPYYGIRDYDTAEWEGGDPDCDHKPPCDAPNNTKMTDGQQLSHAGRFAGEYCHKCGARRIDRQIDLEETPEAYVSRLVDIFREVRRVLRDDGTLWLNLGDSYAGGGGFSPNAPSNKNSLSGKTGSKRYGVGLGIKPQGYIKHKDLIGIPWMVAFALRADGWYLRSDIIWHKRNPMPESVTDRCTKSHEYIFLLSKSQKYYYDNEAVKELSTCYGTDARSDLGNIRYEGKRTEDTTGKNGQQSFVTINDTRNRRSVWTVNTKPFPEAHFAVYLPELIEPCVLAGTSEKGACPVCGKPWERVVDKTERINTRPGRDVCTGKSGGDTDPNKELHISDLSKYRQVIVSKTLGWQPACQCGVGRDPVPCVVLDPFAGSFTTAVAAKQLNRQWIACDISEKYYKIDEDRLRQEVLDFSKSLV